MSKKILLSIFILTLQTRLLAAVWPGDTWQTASPESQGVDSTKLNQAMSYLASKCGSAGTEQVVVVRNGYMIWKGSDIDNDHNVWSATKAFTSTVLGLLIEDGKCTLDSLAKDFDSNLASQYPNVKLRHFATMTSGYDGANHSGEDTCQSKTPFEPTSCLFSPGSEFKYCDDAMNEFANVLTRIAGEDTESFFKDRIADPVGMNDAKWDWGDWGKIDGMVVNGGAGNKGKDLHISARELVRFGLLFLNRGNWNGRQLISSSWVDQATSPQVPSSIPGSNGCYCYNWWHLSGAPVPTYMASGHNNNKCIVIRDWNMVIVRLGKDGNTSGSTYATFLDKVEDALMSSGESPTDHAPAGAVWPGRTWDTRAPTEVDMDPEKLAALADYIGSRGCVVRHGYMIYSWGSQSKLDYVYSAEKPWYAHFLWNALEDGKIPSLDQKVNVWEPRLNDINADLGYKDRKITWRHLANQTSCYGVCENPGEAFNYNDYQMALFWDTLFLKVYGATYDTVDSVVLRPMLTDVLQCQDDPTFVASGHGAKGSLGVSVRDFARFGLLYLRKGNWKGKQLISAKHAVQTGAINVVKWIKDNGFTNVVLEIANEYHHPGFDHRLFKTPEGIAELIRLARRTAPELLVFASGLGDGRLAEPVARASDFLLIHFNGTPLDAIDGRIAALKRFGKPIVCNEDVKVGAQGARAAELCVTNGASWGLMLERTNQHFPFTFNGAADDAIVYVKLKELISPSSAGGEPDGR